MDAQSTTRARVVVSGRVQGVAFRASTQEEATILGLSGWARNSSDGSVEIVVEGPASKVEALVAWCRVGPPAAHVEEARIEYEVPRGERGGFWIRR